MGEREPDRLLVLALATFHTTLLLGVLLLGGHATGAIGGLLAGLGTLSGFALFGILWGATAWTNRRWLTDVDLLAVDTDGWRVVRRGAVWGAPTGVAFFLGLLAVFVLGEIGPNPRLTLDTFLGAAGVVGLLGLVGSLLAVLVGGLVGGVLAALDLGLVGAARRFVPDERDDAVEPDYVQ